MKNRELKVPTLQLGGSDLKELEKKLAQQSPVVLMSRGHSGTRVLAWLCTRLGIELGTREDLATCDVSFLEFSQQIKKMATGNVGVVNSRGIKNKEHRRFLKAANSYYEHLGSPSGLWGWKFPETYLIAPYVQKVFPKVRFIHQVRNGKDLAFKEHLTDDPKRKLGKKVLTAAGALGLPHHLQAALSWAWQVDNFDAFKKELPPESVLDISFEKLCLQPDQTIQKLCEYLQIEPTADAKKYLQDTIKPEKVDQFKENEPGLVAEVETRIASTLKRYDYI
jgi:sulfotransferase family protein